MNNKQIGGNILLQTLNINENITSSSYETSSYENSSSYESTSSYETSSYENSNNTEEPTSSIYNVLVNKINNVDDDTELTDSSDSDSDTDTDTSSEQTNLVGGGIIKYKINYTF